MPEPDMRAPAPDHVPATIEEVDRAWLQAALQPALPAARLRGFDARRIGADFGFASEVHRLRLQGDGVPAAVVLKLWSAADADGLNEARFYREWGDRSEGDEGDDRAARAGGPPHARAGLLRCHHAHADATARRAVLVLEDRSHWAQGDCLELIRLPRARQLVQALAAVHARAWRADGRAPPDGWPVSPRTDRGGAWHAQRRGEFLQRFAGRLQGPGLRLLNDIEARAAAARQRLQAAPVTLLHRDLHLDNVLFDPASGAACLIDWAGAGWGPPAIDLAAVLFDLEDLDDRGAVCAHYLASLAHLQPAVRLDAAALQHDLAAALVLRFAAATCGVARWQPASARAAAIVDAGIARAARLAAHGRAIEPPA